MGDPFTVTTDSNHNTNSTVPIRTEESSGNPSSNSPVRKKSDSPIHRDKPFLPSESEHNEHSNHNSNSNCLHTPPKRKSEPLLRFEAEGDRIRESRRRQHKRRYSDYSECRSSRHRLSSLETDRSRSPYNKRRRYSDISDLFAPDQHSGYRLQAAADLFDEEKLMRRGLTRFVTDARTNRAAGKVREIVQAENVIVAVTKKGLAAAFHRKDLRLLCYLNQTPDESVQSIFWNQLDRSLVVCSSFNAKILKSRSIRIRSIELGRSRGVDVFEGENVSYPGWLEYDDLKHRVLTYNHVTKMYRLWDLADYSVLYQFSRRNVADNVHIEDVKITSDGLIQNQLLEEQQRVLFTVRSLDGPRVLKQFSIGMDLNILPELVGNTDSSEEEKEEADPVFDFMEYHHGFLYVKRADDTALNVYDVRECLERAEAAESVQKFEIPSAYLFLKRSNRLLYHKVESKMVAEKEVESGSYGVLDLITRRQIGLGQKGQVHAHRDSIMAVSRNQTKIVHYSKRREPNGSKMGIVQINSLETGELFGCIECDDKMMTEPVPLSPRWCLSATENAKRARIEVEKNPLKHVSAICYNEEHNEIYTGNRAGSRNWLYLWA